MSQSDFAPSAVLLTDIPFVGTFDRAEVEWTAAILVHALALTGDTFRPMDPRRVAGMLEGWMSEPQWKSLFTSPFFRVDLHGLVDRGFARWEDKYHLAFTDLGIERLRKWVRSSAAPSPSRQGDHHG